MDPCSTLGELEERLRRHLCRSRDKRRAISMLLFRLPSESRKTPSRQRKTTLHPWCALGRKAVRRSLCPMCSARVPDITARASPQESYGWPDFGVWRFVEIWRISPPPVKYGIPARRCQKRRIGSLHRAVCAEFPTIRASKSTEVNERIITIGRLSGDPRRCLASAHEIPPMAPGG